VTVHSYSEQHYNPYQELIDAVTEFVKHNADMSMEVEPVEHTNAVTTHKTHNTHATRTKACYYNKSFLIAFDKQKHKHIIIIIIIIITETYRAPLTERGSVAPYRNKTINAIKQ